MGLEVIATGMYVPSEVISNDYLSSLYLNSYDFQGNVIEEKGLLGSEGIYERTGIRERRKCRSDESVVDLAVNAAKNVYENSGRSVSDLKGIVVASMGDRRVQSPAIASLVQKEIGAEDCFSFDVNMQCAGFPLAYSIVDSYSRNGEGDYLVIGADALTKVVDYTDINCTLFGDGAGAVLLRQGRSGKGLKDYCSWSNPLDGRDKYIATDRNGFLRMEHGRKVMKEAVVEMSRTVDFLRNKVGWDKVDVCIPHQANGRIIENIRKRSKNICGIVFNNIEKYGNMSSATCPIALHNALNEGVIKDGDRIVITSFGSGVVSSAVAVQF